MSTIKESKTTGKKVDVECPQCKTETIHTVERAIEWSEFYDGPDIQAGGTCQIIHCNGCDTLSFRSIEWNSEDLEWDQDGHQTPAETEKLYPERENRSLANELYLGKDVYGIPKIIQTIYRETLSAVQHELPTLAGIGIRAVIEATCQDQKAKKRNLADRIDELASMSLLTPAGATILHGIRLLGNDAAHEMKAPQKKQITAALKVIDHLLLGVYVIPKEASILPKPKPQAKNKTKKTAAVKKKEQSKKTRGGKS